MDHNQQEVPRTPTMEMLKAGEGAMTSIPPYPLAEVEGIWNAMLAACRSATDAE